ncbi:hypothetical protein ALQ28_103803 [Pseudomonas syringae pv. delphinii]|uniref:Uncharacterized protein n=1 Tax=Pseudomonas syringae pv. delphinii TaxID=192088 RepID=A0A0P9R8Y9_9PSED|nr:hypothetical protein ALO72_103286 [Pseudomonas syringae pv. delphinii]RMP17805.1 hypothetical protein ALQ28_103803 [Pseudomonas syringae pv. delphinii]
MAVLTIMIRVFQLMKSTLRPRTAGSGKKYVKILHIAPIMPVTLIDILARIA